MSYCKYPGCDMLPNEGQEWCRQHNPSPIQPTHDDKPKSDKFETFEHMLTVIMIDFGDARVLSDSQDPADKLRSEAKYKDAFDYAKSWLQEYERLRGRDE